MFRSPFPRSLSRILAGAALLFCSNAVLQAQSGSQGTVIVNVTDSSGGLVPAATLKLVEQSTNESRTAVTSKAGTYSFAALPIGNYTLTITMSGYATKEYDAIVVDASQATTINAALSIGNASDTVRVEAETAPLLETTSNAIGTVVDIQQIEDLPINGRDLTAFSSLVAGYSGTYNGLPSTDQGSNIDGVIGNSGRMKFSGNIEPAVSPRLEDIEQMTIQTDQLDLNSGFGQSSTQVNFVSRRGTNQFHGRAYEDFRNAWLNANSWTNEANGQPRNSLKLNDFGGSVGGPILHDKLFFFGTFATKRQPGSFLATDNIFTTAAQGGNFTYTNSSGSQNTVNVLQLAQQYNSSLPSTVNSEIAAQFTKINAAAASGSVTSTPNANFDQVAWLQSQPVTYYYPAVRVDYNPTQKVRMYLSWLMTKIAQPANTAGDFPGSDFANQIAGNATKNYTSSFGLDYIFSPHLLNQFKAGYLYNATFFAYNAAPLYTQQPTVAWNYPGTSGQMSGQVFNLPISTYYPIFNLSDSITYQRGRHTIQFGFSGYREQDHYWNAPAGFNTYSLGLATGDPAINAFTSDAEHPDAGTVPGATTEELSEAGQLYAILTGRVQALTGESPYNIKTQQYNTPGQTGEYPLDERSTAWGWFAEDSWKATSNLTLNFGLRWDFTGAQHDLTGFYHSASVPSIYGPSGVGNLFNPGVLNGDMNPSLTTSTAPYNPWKVTPQPAFGFVWNPKAMDGPLKRLLGGDGTVVRGGFALRRFTEPYQYFWDNATDYGSFYYQYFYLNANNTGQPGTFAPGSLSLGNSLPTFGLSPTSYQSTAPESEFTFQNSTPVYGLDKNIKQPYSESWNFGIQRALGHNLAIELRYNGNRTIHQWINIDPNEINIFENGFLSEFKKAQANLTAYVQAHSTCAVNSSCSFEGSPNSLPIMTAAFGGTGASDFTNVQFATDLSTGQAGKLAGVLAGISGTVPYFCNLVGAGFTPCATNAGYSGSGAGYAINFFQANPYASGTDGNFGPANATGQLVSAGYSNYNALQVDLRQGTWHGLQYDANYTWSHSLGVASNNQWTGAFNAFSLRNLSKSYGPSLFDLRHVLHANGTYDLPFGRGRQYLSHGALLDRVVGGWTVGSIATWQSGEPAQLTGGYNTFNDYGDSGITLNGVTPSQLQHAVGVHHVPGQTFADLIDPKYLVSNVGGGANSQYITPNTVPGTIGNILFLHGPRQFYQDISVTKAIPLHESLRLRLQSSFLNAWNHPVFGDFNGYGFVDAGLQDHGFGLGGVSNESSGETPGFGRVIEIRANIDF